MTILDSSSIALHIFEFLLDLKDFKIEKAFAEWPLLVLYFFPDIAYLCKI